MGLLTNPAAALGVGRLDVTAAGTAEPLADPTPCRRVVISADAANTNAVVVGDVNVDAAVSTRAGIPLFGDPADGRTSVALEVNDLSLIYVDALTNGEGVSFTYEAG